VERTRTHNLAVGSVCKLRAETLPTQPPRHPLYHILLHFIVFYLIFYRHSIYQFSILAAMVSNKFMSRQDCRPNSVIAKCNNKNCCKRNWCFACYWMNLCQDQGRQTFADAEPEIGTIFKSAARPEVVVAELAYKVCLKTHSHCAPSRAGAAQRRHALIEHVEIKESIYTERVVKQCRAASRSKIETWAIRAEKLDVAARLCAELISISSCSSHNTWQQHVVHE